MLWPLSGFRLYSHKSTILSAGHHHKNPTLRYYHKMFVNTTKSKYVVNCDWLQYSVTLVDGDSSEFCCPDDCRIEFLVGNNIFRQRVVIYRVSDGCKLMTLLFQPYSRILNPFIMTVQINNYCLYASGIAACNRLLNEIVPVAFNSMGRIDVCLDFVAGSYEMSFIRKLWHGDIYVQRKNEGSNFWHKTDSAGANRFVHCLSWGSKTSEIKVKLYNKSRELGVSVDNPMGDKPYIVEQWIQNDMDTANVWRLEFSICSSGSLLVNGQAISLENMRDGMWLWELWKQLYNDRFICRKNEGKSAGHHNDDTRVSLLYVPESDNELEWRAGTEDNMPHSEVITLLRKAMETLSLEPVRTSKSIFGSYANVILTLCQSKKIRNYFMATWERSPEVILAEMADDIGVGQYWEEPNFMDGLI